MKPTCRSKTHDIVYKILQGELSAVLVAIPIAEIILHILGHTELVLLKVEFLLFFVSFLLSQADVLVCKILYKSSITDEKINRKHTIAACITLVGTAVCILAYALALFGGISGVFALVMGIVLVVAFYATVVSKIVAVSLERPPEAEDAEEEEPTEDADAQEGTRPRRTRTKTQKTVYIVLCVCVVVMLIAAVSIGVAGLVKNNVTLTRVSAILIPISLVINIINLLFYRPRAKRPQGEEGKQDKD